MADDNPNLFELAALVMGGITINPPPDYERELCIHGMDRKWAKIINREIINGMARSPEKHSFTFGEVMDYFLNMQADPIDIAKWLMFRNTGMDKYEYEEYWRDEFRRQIELQEIADEDQMWIFFEVFGE